jgi:transcriptional regulator
MEDKAMTAMMRGIVAFDISVTRLEGKSKMSQNRSPEDIRSAVDALTASDRPSDQDLASLMTERNPAVFTPTSS